MAQAFEILNLPLVIHLLQQDHTSRSFQTFPRTRDQVFKLYEPGGVVVVGGQTPTNAYLGLTFCL